MMTDGMTILPCPFCGAEQPGEDDSFVSKDNTKHGALQCFNCCSMGPEINTHYDAVSTWKVRAIATWNDRPPAGTPSEDTISSKGEGNL